MSPLQGRLVRSACLGVACALLTVGCRSIVSTHVTPDPIEGGWNTRKIGGVPVTVSLPTHLEIRVVERRYYQPGGNFEPVPGATVRYVTEKVQHKDHVFMVDAVRPGAGTLKQSAEFKNDKNPQFFSKYESKVEDKTINTIAELIPGLPDVIGNLKKARAIANTPTPQDAALAMAYTDHVVAIRVFDVYDPNLTELVQQFMAEHVNNCQQPCPAGCAVPAK
jgi:hypothetical protein